MNGYVGAVFDFLRFLASLPRSENFATRWPGKKQIQGHTCNFDGNCVGLRRRVFRPQETGRSDLIGYVVGIEFRVGVVTSIYM